jgi:hypothetical protein
VNVAGTQRVPGFPTTSPVVWTLMNLYEIGCHWRRIRGWENDQSASSDSPWFNANPSAWVP